MNQKRILKGIALTAAVCLAVMSGLAKAEGETDFLTGKVTSLESRGISVEKRMSSAFQAFKKDGKGDQYFSVYMFQTQHDITINGCGDSNLPFEVGVKSDEIVLKKKSKDTRQEFMTESEEGEPVGLLFLHEVSGRNSEIIDMQLLDKDNTYDFKDARVYWMGDVETDESVRFLEDLFEESGDKLKETILFTITLHDSPRVYAFLKEAATGPYSLEIRKNAVFWLGNTKDPRSIKLLKEIYAKEKNTEVREHTVFALQLFGTQEAAREIIRIAKDDASRNVRKQAIFWLGQMATKECVKALKGFVDEGQDTEIKKEAVFALSQLPEDQAVPLLVDIARNNTNPEVRKQAIFWLGQTDSDEALKLFEEILLKK